MKDLKVHFSSLNFLMQDDTEVSTSMSLQNKLVITDVQNLEQQYIQLHNNLKIKEEYLTTITQLRDENAGMASRINMLEKENVKIKEDKNKLIKLQGQKKKEEADHITQLQDKCSKMASHIAVLELELEELKEKLECYRKGDQMSPSLLEDKESVRKHQQLKDTGLSTTSSKVSTVMSKYIQHSARVKKKWKEQTTDIPVARKMSCSSLEEDLPVAKKTSCSSLEEDLCFFVPLNDDKKSSTRLKSQFGSLSGDFTKIIVSSDEDDMDHTVASRRQQRHGHQHSKEEEQVAVLPEDQDGAVMHITTPMPIQPTTDALCIGIKQASPLHSSMVTVLWVHPQSPLKDIYTTNGTAKLPTLGQCINRGRNASVYVCSVTMHSGEMRFACKVEQKKPLYKNPSIFEKVCQLEDNEHFVIVHAYLQEIDEKNKIGYLLMEYFPLRDLRSSLHEFNDLALFEEEVKEIHDKMKESKTNTEFGKYRTRWWTVQRKRDKLTNCFYYLVYSIIESLKFFHAQHLVHLDVKEHNILLRKTCEHKDKLICECDSPPFNVLIGDYDYCHEVGSDVSNPRTKGTKGYQALSMRYNTGTQVAKPILDLFGLLVTIIKVRSNLGHKHKCWEIMLNEWEQTVDTNEKLETQQSKVKRDLERLESCEQPDVEMNLDEDKQNCTGCKALRKGITLAASQLKTIDKKMIYLGTILQCAFSDIDKSKLQNDLIYLLMDTCLE